MKTLYLSYSEGKSADEIMDVHVCNLKAFGTRLEMSCMTRAGRDILDKAFTQLS